MTRSARTSRPSTATSSGSTRRSRRWSRTSGSTAQVSDIYADVLPEVGDDPAEHGDHDRHARGPRGPAQRAVQQRLQVLRARARTFLDDNGDNLIRLGEVSRAQLRVLARYSTEFPCLLEGIVNAGERQAEAFRGFTLHIVLETLPNQPRAYTPADVPRLGEDRGPTCLHLPNPPGSQEQPASGASPTSRTASTSRPARAPSGPPPATARPRPAASSVASAATPARRRSPTCSPTCSLPASATTAEQVPDLGGCWSARWPAAPRVLGGPTGGDLP